MGYFKRTKPADGRNENGQPITAGNGGSQNFRIPCIVTLKDGTIVAAADVRWDAEADGGGLDIIVSSSSDQGKTWSYTFANYLGDNGNVYDENSSTLMDPALATDGKRLYLLADLFAGGYSAFRKNLKCGSGFTKEGWLRVRKRGQKDYDCYVKEHRIFGADGTEISDYAVDDWFYVTKNGICQGNLFFQDTPWEAYPTCYLCLTTSGDSGRTWSAPQLIFGVKKDEEDFYGTGPGRGLVTADGTLLFSCYNGAEASVIFSKDQGKTWNRFGKIPGTESQPVELADGTIRIFFRNLQDAICYADVVKTGAGDSAERSRAYEVTDIVNTGVPNCSHCMVSALAYSKKVDGKNAVLVCCPSVVGTWDGRYNGKIYTFLLDDENNMALTYTYAVNGTEEKEFFAYSCMAQLPDGSIGLLYEDSCIHYLGRAHGVGQSRVVYRKIAMEEIAPGAVIRSEQ